MDQALRCLHNMRGNSQSGRGTDSKHIDSRHEKEHERRRPHYSADHCNRISRFVLQWCNHRDTGHYRVGFGSRFHRYHSTRLVPDLQIGRFEHL